MAEPLDRSVRPRADGSRAGAPSAEFRALYEERREPMIRVARLLTGSHEIAEEIVQEAFIRLHGAWARAENPPAFLHRIVVNLAKNHLRRAGLERDRTPRLRVDQAVATNPELDEMWAALETLPSKYRLALVLRYYEDLSVDQIAHAMGVRPGTAKSLIHRGLAQLEKRVTT